MKKLTRGERFKDARTVHNIHGSQTMNAVQESTGVSASLIADLENDEKSRKVNYIDVATLAAHYGVTSDWLCGLSDDHQIKPCATDELGLSEDNIHFLKSLSDLRKLNQIVCKTKSEKENHNKKIVDVQNRLVELFGNPESPKISELSVYAKYGMGLFDAFVSAARKYPDDVFWNFINIMLLVDHIEDYRECDLQNQIDIKRLNAWDWLAPTDYVKFRANEIAKAIDRYMVEAFSDEDMDYHI